MKVFWLMFVAMCLLATPVRATEAFFENDGDALYRIYDETGKALTSRAGRVYVGDEYIASDNRLYRVDRVDEAFETATAVCLGDEPPLDRAAFSTVARAEAKKLIAMYSTHSDESYETGDGTSSKNTDAGIYDVGEAFKKELEALGIEVQYSEETFLPHDSGAYRRSRGTAKQLAEQMPAALFDLHRDGIPDPDEYAHEIKGEAVSKVRLEVGRSNANADANRAFAKAIKSAADKKYPGFVRDIYIGKGNYNQELYPKALLLEFGTHTSDKQEVIESTRYLATVVNDVLFGESASAATASEDKGAGKGVWWIVGLAVVAAVVYALAATGTFKGAMNRIGRGTSEITGGLFGKKRK